MNEKRNKLLDVCVVVESVQMRDKKVQWFHEFMVYEVWLSLDEYKA